MKRFGYLLLLLPTLLLAAPAERTLTMAFNETVPWKFHDANGEPQGIDLELARQLCTRLSLRLVIKPAPLARALDMMKNGQVDIMTFLLKTPEREQFITFIEPPYQRSSDKVFYLRSADPAPLQRYEDLASLQIGIKRGASYGAKFDADPDLHKEAVTDTEQNFRKLLLGRLDTVLATESEGDYLLLTHGWKAAVRKAPLRFAQQANVYIGFAKHSPHQDLLPALSRELEALIQSGEVARIAARYGLTLQPAASAAP